ncbi:MAG: class II fructose-1,6-bisphosphate aldolase [Oscillospiraceae bacterium]|jgi:fructose-bisphosphate aldolase class II|nr:class II fructose-1,6-bisphosphate aldolase [Oscillospiraceae bacterium]
MGLVNTKEMLKKAYDAGYAVGAFNVNNMEIIQGITEACEEMQSPVILQVSAGARKYAKHKYLVKLVEAAVEETNIAIALHLDHGDSFELCKSCIDGGFTSVMIDGSSLSYDNNVEVTKKVVDYAHKYSVTVEGELGRLAGLESGASVSKKDSFYTEPSQVKDFVTKTGVDSLAIAIGTSHGAYKFKPERSPSLRFDILEEIQKILPGFPIVLHGASSVLPYLVEKINKYGGDLENAIGVPEKILKKSSEMAVCKINIDSDLRLAVTASIREHLALNPKHFDPRQYLSDAKTAVKEVVKHKIKNVCGFCSCQFEN